MKIIKLKHLGWYLVGMCCCAFTCLGEGRNAYAIEQAAYESTVQAQMQQLAEYRQELDALKAKDDGRQVIAKKMAMYLVMITMLKEKRELFQERLNSVTDRYEQGKHSGMDENELNAIHERIIAMSNEIENLTVHIKGYMNALEALRTEQETKAVHVMTIAEAEKQKKKLLSMLETLHARQINLEKGGVNPNEIAQTKQSIRVIVAEITRCDEALGLSPDESKACIENVLDTVVPAQDAASQKRKFATDDYVYRNKERQVTKNADLRLTEKKVAKVRYQNAENAKIYDERLQGERIEHSVAGR